MFGAGSDKLSDLQKKIAIDSFHKYESLLDEPNKGPTWLYQPKIAEIVQEAIHYRDQREYDLYAYCLMPNHVHLVFKKLNRDHLNGVFSDYPLTDVLRSLKWFTALKANRLLKRAGAVWQAESYDHVIRNVEELENIIIYTLNNPVKQGLSKNGKTGLLITASKIFWYIFHKVSFLLHRQSLESQIIPY